MSPSTPGPDPLATAQKLTGALTEMSGRLDAVTARGNTTRRIAWGLVVSVVLDVILTVVLALIAVQAHNASTSANAASMRASHASASNLALCRAGNVARGQQVQLWEHLLNASKPKTAKEARVLAAFGAYVHKVFMPRNCAKLGTKQS